MKDKKGLMPKASREKKKDNVDEQLEILKNFKDMIKNNSVTDFIIVAVDGNRQFIMATYCQDTMEGIGMLETGKYTMLSQQQPE